MSDSEPTEPRARKSCDKWVKSHEMSQISKWKDFQRRLWVLEVSTCHFKAGDVNMMSILLFRFCNFYVLLAAILKHEKQ